jgi:hypothetical protein
MPRLAALPTRSPPIGCHPRLVRNCARERDPVRRDFSIPSLASLECWVTRRSLSSGRPKAGPGGGRGQFEFRHCEPPDRTNADKSSLPGLTRQSIFFENSFLGRWMDARIKSGHDECFCMHTDLISNSKLVSKHNFAISPHVSREGWPAGSALSLERAQGMPGARCARCHVCRGSG